MVCFFSGFTFIHGFYTWPKLYPVAYLLIVAAYLLTERYHQVRGRRMTGALVGVALALAMLCHGGSFFAILGLACSLLFLRRCPSPRFLLAMTVAAVLTYTPWVLYQKFYDPPGDRLLKFHLAGVQEPHPEVSLANLLISSYKKAGLHKVIQYKITNFRFLMGGLDQSINDVVLLTKNLGPSQARVRDTAAKSPALGEVSFSSCPSMGLFSLGPLALLLAALSIRRKRVEFMLAARLWLCTLLTLVCWCLLMFGPIWDRNSSRQLFLGDRGAHRIMPGSLGAPPSCGGWRCRGADSRGRDFVHLGHAAATATWQRIGHRRAKRPHKHRIRRRMSSGGGRHFVVLCYPGFGKTVEDADLR